MRATMIIGLSVLTASPLAAQTDPAAAFGAREGVIAASLSPDGNLIALIRPSTGQGSTLSVIDLRLPANTPPKVIATASGKPERLGNCRWASDARLLCLIYGVIKIEGTENAYIARTVALDTNGGNLAVLQNTRGSGDPLGYGLFGGRVIDWSPGENGHVLMMREYVPETTTGNRAAQTKDGIGVDNVDSVSLKTQALEQPRKDAVDYISDGHGTVRVMGSRVSTSSDGYDRGGRRYSARRKDSRAWEPLSMVDIDGEGFDPYAVDSSLDVAYGLKRLDGRIAAYSKALDGSGTEKLIFAHPEVDVSGFLQIGRRGRVVGVNYVTDRREASYFDPTLAKLAAALGRALPNRPLIRFVDANQDESRLMIWAGGDNDPGMYYLYDKNTRHLDELALERPELAKTPLATVKPVKYRTADGTMVPGYLTLPPDSTDKGLPAIVMPHGGPGARDEWGFDWLAQFFANRGYAVLQPNFRGSTGYGDQWYRNNGFKSWRSALGDINDGGRWLVSEGIADPAKMAIFGWSYGGYAALQSGVIEPGLFKSIVAIAPVTDLDRLKEDRRRWSDFNLVSRFVGSGPHIAEGSPARHTDAIVVPVLMFHGTSDRNVDVGHARLMDGRLRDAKKSSKLVTYPDLDHYLDDSAARADMLRQSDKFLRETMDIK